MNGYSSEKTVKQLGISEALSSPQLLPTLRRCSECLVEATPRTVNQSVAKSLLNNSTEHILCEKLIVA
jgi:hypothetical protein